MTVPRGCAARALARCGVLAALLACAAGAALRAPAARFFAPDLIRGGYGLAAAIPRAAACPRAIALDGYAHTDRGVAVEHVKVSIGGARCGGGGGGDIVMSPTDHAIELPHVNKLLDEQPVLNSLVVGLLEARGTFLGVSAQQMACGATTLPKNAVYAFANDTAADIPLLSGRLFLKQGRRHMVLFLDSVKTPIICAYEADRAPPSSAGAAPPAKAKPAAIAPAAAADAPSGGASTGGRGVVQIEGEPALPGSIEPSPEATPLPAGAAAATATTGAACFSAGGLVRLSTGAVVRMDALRTGDAVQVSATEFSRVYMFTHRDAAARAEFVELVTAGGRALAVTPGHLVYVDGALRPAREAQPGAALADAAGRADVIVAVRRDARAGVYNPQTVHGDIVVNGIRASAYTDAVRPAPAHALLAPLRAAFKAAGRSSAALENGAPSAVLWPAVRLLS